MAKGMLLPLLLLSGLAFADTPAVDEDGFTHPLRNLEFNPGWTNVSSSAPPFRRWMSTTRSNRSTGASTTSTTGSING